MKIVIFGTGRMYQKMKHKFRKDVEIVAFIDNDVSKWGCRLDNIQILSPQEMSGLEYDFVFLMSVHYVEMGIQLIEMGIPKRKIYDVEWLGKICESEPVQHFGEIPTHGVGEKILLISHSLTSTGAQNVLYNAIEVLRKKDCCLAVVSREDGVLKDRILELGIPVAITKDLFWENEEFVQMALWADKIIVNTLWFYYVVEELLVSGKKIIWWIHETGLLKDLDADIFARINRMDSVSVYGVSPLVKRAIIKEFGGEMKVSELPFGLPDYKEAEKGGFWKKKKIFAVIGAMGWIKGQDIFIRSAAILSEIYRNTAEFWIVGRGQMEEKDLRQAQSCPSIKIMGEIENRKMPELYSQIDVVVCCSREEAMSVVVVEGCMTEKLVIVSDAAGIADYITDGEDGLIFHSEDTEQLVGLMAWAMEHEEQARRIGKASRKVYEKHFAMERFEERLLEAVMS